MQTRTLRVVVDGQAFTRTTSRDYRFAVMVRGQDGWGPASWSETREEATKTAEWWRANIARAKSAPAGAVRRMSVYDEVRVLEVSA